MPEKKNLKGEGGSSKMLRYFPRLILIVLIVIIGIFLVWSMSGGGSWQTSQGIQTPPTSDTPSQPPREIKTDNTPETGTGGDQPSKPAQSD